MALTIGNINYTPLDNDGGIRAIIPIISAPGDSHVYASLSFVLDVPQTTPVGDLTPLAMTRAREVMEEATALFPEPTP